MEIWKQIAINDLSRYANLENSIRSLQDRISSLTIQMEGGNASLGSTPVSGGRPQLEDKYVNSIALKGKLENQLKTNMLEYKAVRRAMESLSRQDQRVLHLSYINRGKLHIENIMAEFCVERSQAYRYKDNALTAFILAMYGR